MMTTLDDYDFSFDELHPEAFPVSAVKQECIYCGTDLESRLRRNPEAALELLKLRPNASPEEKAALQAGMLCVDCLEGMSCPHCGEIGGQIFEFDHGIDPETGCHDAGIMCSLCARTQPLPAIAAEDAPVLDWMVLAEITVPAVWEGSGLESVASIMPRLPHVLTVVAESDMERDLRNGNVLKEVA